MDILTHKKKLEKKQENQETKEFYTQPKSLTMNDGGVILSKQ